MKALISTILTMGALFVMMNCSSSEDPDPQLSDEEKQMNRLAKTWTLGTVTYGDEVITDRFDDFALTFSKTKAYSASGNLGGYDYEPFKVSGTWDFKDGNLNVVNRDDGIDMVVEVTDTDLVLIFTMTEENGKVAGLGAYKFELLSE